MANLRFEVNQTSTKVTSIEVSVGAHEFERNLEEDAKGDERRENQTEQSQNVQTSRIQASQTERNPTDQVNHSRFCQMQGYSDQAMIPVV